MTISELNNNIFSLSKQNNGNGEIRRREDIATAYMAADCERIKRILGVSGYFLKHRFDKLKLMPRP